MDFESWHKVTAKEFADALLAYGDRPLHMVVQNAGSGRILEGHTDYFCEVRVRYSLTEVEVYVRPLTRA